ncbi:MAG: M28 family peptidase [Bacteroidales bacterium]|nr:M28 family peptidase [Bacteroidales bacterium]
MRVTLLLVLVLFAKTIFAQDPLVLKYSQTITAEELKQHLNVIASDAYEGRFTGAKGLEMAAEYLTKEFKSDELTGPVTGAENPFYQVMDLEQKSWTKRRLTAGKQVFENHKDIIFIQSPTGEEEYEVIFAGYGIYSDKYNDYKNIDVKGKLVAFLLGEPVDKNGIYLVTGTKTQSLPVDTSINQKVEAIQGKAMASMMRGAKGFILIEKNEKEGEKIMDLLNRYMGDVEVSFPGKKTNPMQSFPFLYMTPSKAAQLFGVKPKAFEKTVAGLLDTANSTSGLYTQKIKIEAEQKTESVKSANVLGFIEGTDKKNEIVVLSAHYDHDGIKGGEVFNGADDNGSGTVSIIELAEAFATAKKEGHGPRRSMLFIAFTGEERGLLGSGYYAKHPIFSLDSTVVNLNIDMIGRIDKEHTEKPDYLYIIGADYLSSELDSINKSIAQTYAPELVLDYTYNAKDHPEHLYERSDQIKFAEKGVPVIFYFSGLHDDYHTPADDVDKINFEVMEKRVRMVFAAAWELANREERVKVDK